MSEAVFAALKAVTHPATGKDVVSSGAIESVHLEDGVATISLRVTPETVNEMEPVRQAIEAAAAKAPGIERARAIMTAARPAAPQATSAPQAARSAAPRPERLAGVDKVIAVASGKGGVGKSTTAVNLAYAMIAAGKRVALIDCDVYGPSAGALLGLEEKPEAAPDNRIIPLVRDGLEVMSMSFLLDPGRAAIWRGPVVMRAIKQLLGGVVWDHRGRVDVAILDLPPGTGDVQLTIAQTVIVDGAVIVSTPQDLALIDARRAVDMFGRTKTPVLGVIENMTTFICPKCGEQSDIFGHGGAEETAREIGARFLGGIPLAMEIRKGADTGAPVTRAAPEGQQAKVYRQIADSLISALFRV